MKVERQAEQIREIRQIRLIRFTPLLEPYRATRGLGSSVARANVGPEPPSMRMAISCGGPRTAP